MTERSETMKIWHNEVEWVVAESPKHASDILAALCGPAYVKEMLDGEPDEEVWVEWTKPLTIYDEDAAPPVAVLEGDEDAHRRVTKPAAEWILTLPEGGFLCSTEW